MTDLERLRKFLAREVEIPLPVFCGVIFFLGFLIGLISA